MDAEAVNRLRAFSRIMAERTGTVTDSFLGRGRPMGESRVLWEIGHGVDLRDLRARLGLDSGYMSRVLRSLTRQRLITVKAGERDRRVRRVALTKSGRAEVRAIDRLSNGAARKILEPLAETQRKKLLNAIEVVGKILEASAVTVAFEDPRAADSQWCLEQYYAELRVRFKEGFDPVRDPVDNREMMPPGGVLAIARLHDRPVGCAALRFHAGAPPEVKRMWVAPEARGLGIAKRLLGALEDRARKTGAKAVQLETNRALKEAIALYRSMGYREIPPFNDVPYAHHWFEKSLKARS